MMTWMHTTNTARSTTKRSHRRWERRRKKNRARNCEPFYTNKSDNKRSQRSNERARKWKKHNNCLHALCLITNVMHISYCVGDFVFTFPHIRSLFGGDCCYFVAFCFFFFLLVSNDSSFGALAAVAWSRVCSVRILSSFSFYTTV